MKGIFEIFQENISYLQKSIQKNNFFGCTNISDDLILVSLLSDFDEGVFNWYVLKTLFYQLDFIHEHYPISEDDKNEIRNKCFDQISIFEKSLEENNKEKYYVVLKDLVYFTMQLESKYRRLVKEIPREYHNID